MRQEWTINWGSAGGENAYLVKGCARLVEAHCVRARILHTGGRPPVNNPDAHNMVAGICAARENAAAGAAIAAAG